MNIVVFCSLPNQNQLVSIHFLSYLKISQHFEIKVHIYNIDDISLILTVLCFWLEYGIENYTDQGIWNWWSRPTNLYIAAPSMICSESTSTTVRMTDFPKLNSCCSAWEQAVINHGPRFDQLIWTIDGKATLWSLDTEEMEIVNQYPRLCRCKM